MLTAKDSTNSNERTEVRYGEEAAMKILLQTMANVKKEAVICSDSNSPAFEMTVEPVKKGFINLKQRNVRIRQITEITKDNLSFCKELLKYVELRHMDNVKGNMAVSETEYVATAVLQGTTPLTETIYSNVKAFLDQQSYFFETLWSKAIPAANRIKELEEGKVVGRDEIIENPKEIEKILVDLIKSSKKEIMLILPSETSFKREKKMGVMNLLAEAASKKEIKVRILLQTEHEEDQLQQEVQSLRELHRIGIRITKSSCLESPPVRITVVVVDRKASLVVELKDDSKQTFTEAIGSAVYTSSEPKVISFVTIFDSFWNQNELYEQVREVNKRLQKANEQLQRQDTMQKEFINIAAHELRTPIQPILGMADLLGSQFSAQDDDKGKTTETTKQKGEIMKDDLAIILRNAERLERLCSDILDTARIESGKFHLNIQQFDLNDVILSLVEDARDENRTTTTTITTPDKEGVKIHYFPADEKIMLNGDRDRISQVLWNLLNNSLKFTDKGGSISISTKKDDRHVTVTVKDTGAGIDPKILPKLFTKFVTKSEKGTGLGLFISKSIIEAHGGKIWAENNKKEKGAIFRFTLPIV